jgi:hypothetical protein
MTSMFSEIETTKAVSEAERSYFLPGKYRVQIDVVHTHKKLVGGHLFLVETTVLESNNPEIEKGEQRNWAQPFDMVAAMPRIKCFVGAAHGYCPKRNLDGINKFVTKEICDKAVSPENPLKGVVIDLECYNKKSQRTGKDFTIHMWLPVAKQ